MPAHVQDYSVAGIKELQHVYATVIRRREMRQHCCIRTRESECWMGNQNYFRKPETQLWDAQPEEVYTDNQVYSLNNKSKILPTAFTFFFSLDKAASQLPIRVHVFVLHDLATKTRIRTGWLHGWTARDSPCPVRCSYFTQFSRYDEANIARSSSHLYVPHILPNNIIEFLVYKCKIVHWEFGAACPFMFPKVAAVAEFYRPSFPSS